MRKPWFSFYESTLPNGNLTDLKDLTQKNVFMLFDLDNFDKSNL